MQELKVDQKELEKRVKYVVSLSKEIPWYVRKYKELGIDPDEIRSPQDLLKAYEKGLYTTPQDLPELVYYKHPEAKGPFYTSGTSGKPKEIWLNPDDNKRIISQFTKAFKTLKKEDKILSCLPREPAISGYMTTISLLDLGLDFRNFPAQEIGGNIPKFLETYKNLKPTVLMSLTTFAYRLPLMLEASKIPSYLRAVFVGAEPSTIERRESIGRDFNSLVYDVYASSENGLIGYEFKPFSDEHIVPIPQTLLFLVKDRDKVSVGEGGEILVTNLYETTAEPYMVLINYKIGDWAKCLEEDNGIVTSISEIRREAAYLAGAKLHPQEVEKAIEELEKYKRELTGEYFIITHSDSQRRAIAEVRIEGKRNISPEDKKGIEEKVREKIYSNNFPVWNEVENAKNAKLLIEITNPGELYKGYEQYIKPGKPKRLLVLTDV